MDNTIPLHTPNMIGMDAGGPPGQDITSPPSLPPKIES